MNDQTLSFLKPLAEMTGLSLQNCLYLCGGCLLALLILQSLVSSIMTPKTTPGGGFTPTSSSAFKSAKKTREWLTLVGPVGAGKTSLFYKLLTKDHRDTVSSTDCNVTEGLMEIKLPKSVTGTNSQEEHKEGVSKALKLIDIPGHYHFREKIQ